MSFLSLDVGEVVEGGYRFGRSDTVYRGSAPDFSQPYVAVVGASETYGPYVDLPYPALLNQELPNQVLNFGFTGGGPNFVLRDPVLLEACNRAEVVVLSVSHAWAVTNRLYTVGHTQNTALHEISEQLAIMFPSVDLDQFEYVRPMVAALARAHPENFQVLEMELREAWLARMRDLVDRIEAPIVLFGMVDDQLDAPDFDPQNRRIGPEMVSRSMFNRLSGYVSNMIVYEADKFDQCLDGSDRHAEGEEIKSALAFPGETMHVAAAEKLYPVVKSLLQSRVSPAPNKSKLRSLLKL
ncbi:MAG: DUF6473 family protein [Pseudomonadota bacterium]